MAAKKRAPTRTAKPAARPRRRLTIPSAAMMRELDAVLARHGWRHGLIVPHGRAITAADAVCPPGTVPTQVTVKDAAGNLIVKTVCL